MLFFFKRTASAIHCSRLERRSDAADVPGPWADSVRTTLKNGRTEDAAPWLIKGLKRFPRSRELAALAVSVERRTGTRLLPKPGTRAKFFRDLSSTDAAGALAEAADADAFAGVLARLTGENPSSPGFPAALAALERRDVPVGTVEYPDWIRSEVERLAATPGVKAVVLAGVAGVVAQATGGVMASGDPRIAGAARLASVVIPATKSLGIGAHLESVVRGEDAETVCVGTYGHVLVVTFEKGAESRRILESVRDVASALGRAFMKSALAPETNDA